MNKIIDKSVWYNTYWVIDSYLSEITIEVICITNELKAGDKINLQRGERFIRKIIYDDDNHPPIVVTKFRNTV